jgi:hypothetical protein
MRVKLLYSHLINKIASRPGVPLVGGHVASKECFVVTTVDWLSPVTITDVDVASAWADATS